MSAARPLRPRGTSLAVVVFGPSEIPYLRFLKPGYRHCMVCVQDAGAWHLLDPLSNRIEITHLGKARPDELIELFNNDGRDAVLVQRLGPIAREVPWAPFTCVEMVKRVLGIHARRIVTPWQLRRYLDRMQGLSIYSNKMDNQPLHITKG